MAGKSLKLLWPVLASEKFLQRGNLGAEAALSLVSGSPWVAACDPQPAFPTPCCGDADRLESPLRSAWQFLCALAGVKKLRC